MPYNPVKKFPEVIYYLNMKGYTYQATTEALTAAVMATLGVVNEKTIGNYIKAMKLLGYIQPTKTMGIWQLCEEGEPGIFSEAKKEDKKGVK